MFLKLDATPHWSFLFEDNLAEIIHCEAYSLSFEHEVLKTGREMTKSNFAIHYAVQHTAEHSVNAKLLNSAGQKIAALCSRLLHMRAGNGCVSLS